VAELESFESARLFAERASEKRLGFALVPENVQPIAEICRTLEGMPLAIELAAARVRALSVGELSERLADSLKVLTGGGRTQTPRQRSLKGTLDWSHDLLSGAERVLFRRLSVFAGGWTLEASEAVGFGEDVEEGEILDLLSGLVDKSLVVAEPTAGVGVRYRMLEPVRLYALEKLKQDGEVEEVRRRQATFFLALAEEAKTAFAGPEEVGWLHRLEAEHDNLRVALSWSLGNEDGVLSLRLAAALWWFWRGRGHIREGAGWLEEALGKADHAEPITRAGALYGLGFILDTQNDSDRAQACLEEALAIYEELGDRVRVADSLGTLGWNALIRGDPGEAKAFFEESLAAGWGLENRKDTPRILSGLALIASEEGDFERSRRLYEEALALYRTLGEAVGVAWVLSQLAYTELAQSNLEGLAGVAGALGQHLRATRLWGAAEAMRTVSRPWSSTERMLHETLLAAARSRLDEATWEAAFSEGKAMMLEEAVEYALSVDGEADAPKPDASESSSANEPPILLTRREEEIAALMARGLTNRQIACDLSISEHTAATHVRSILKKLGLQSRAQMMVMVGGAVVVLPAFPKSAKR
jgi:DNA-binding CsgD family transcriptional regulator